MVEGGKKTSHRTAAAGWPVIRRIMLFLHNDLNIYQDWGCWLSTLQSARESEISLLLCVVHIKQEISQECLELFLYHVSPGYVLLLTEELLKRRPPRVNSCKEIFS